MNDEAAAHYSAIIDNMAFGIKFLQVKCVSEVFTILTVKIHPHTSSYTLYYRLMYHPKDKDTAG